MGDSALQNPLLRWDDELQGDSHDHLGKYVYSVKTHLNSWAVKRRTYVVSRKTRIDAVNGDVIETEIDTVNFRRGIEVKIFGNVLPDFMVFDGEWRLTGGPFLLLDPKPLIGGEIALRKHPLLMFTDPFDILTPRSNFHFGAKAWTQDRQFYLSPMAGFGAYFLAFLNANATFVMHNDRFKTWRPTLFLEGGLSLVNFVEIDYGYNLFLNNNGPSMVPKHQITVRASIPISYW